MKMDLKEKQIVYVDGKPYIKCNVVMLPTESKSHIYKNRYGIPQFRQVSGLTRIDSIAKNQNLYITSNEKIKEGDWYIDDCNEIRQSVTSDKEYWEVRKDYKKIITTTDTSLALLNEQYFDVNKKRKSAILEQKNLPQPSQQFIEKYIEEYNKGNVITDVLVEVEDNGDYADVDGMDINDTYWKSEWELKLDSQNQITIRKQKDSWSRYEVICLLDKLIRDSQNNPKEVIIHHRVTTKWIQENL